MMIGFFSGAGVAGLGVDLGFRLFDVLPQGCEGVYCFYNLWRKLLCLVFSSK